MLRAEQLHHGHPQANRAYQIAVTLERYEFVRVDKRIAQPQDKVFANRRNGSRRRIAALLTQRNIGETAKAWAGCAANLLRERRRRRLEASDEPYVEQPLHTLSLPQGKRLSIAETLRQHLNLARESDRSEAAAATAEIATDKA